MSKSRALFDLTGSHTSSQVDLTGKTSKKINVSGGPHRFTGKKEIYGMYHISAGTQANVTDVIPCYGVLPRSRSQETPISVRVVTLLRLKPPLWRGRKSARFGAAA